MPETVTFHPQITMPAGDYLWFDRYAKSEGFNSASDFAQDLIKRFVKETKPMCEAD